MHRLAVPTALPFLAAFTLLNAGHAAEAPRVWTDPLLVRQLASAPDATADFVVVLGAAGDLSPARQLLTKQAKGRFVYERLRRLAEETQPPVRRALEDAGATVRPFWIANALLVRGRSAALQAVNQRTDVREIVVNQPLRLGTPTPTKQATLLLLGPEWGLNRINAPAVWARGFTGQGVVVGGQDTGVAWDHPALKRTYRGWNGVSADHSYHWYDAIGASTGSATRVPSDGHGHGTHTMGTMVGSNATDQVGVAPDARWIGCRNMDNGGNGTFASYLACFQWFLAPTDLDGLGADPDRAPDVMNNSWAFTTGEGCTNPVMLQAAVEACRAAGIVVVASAGNSGPTAGSCSDPPALYDGACTVGSVDASDTIAWSSSRGPVTRDGSGRLKPDVSAPGVGVRSCIPGGGYASWSGTSMAGPHVAGTVALILSAHPGLRGQVDAIETLLTRTAVPRGDPVPNNTYGWGRLDAQAAVGLDDSDSDGMPDWWENVFRLCPTNAADAVVDTDGDGGSNRDEWLANTDPTTSVSALRVTALHTTPQGAVSVTWNSRQDGFDSPRVYDVLCSTNVSLPVAAWIVASSNIAAAGDTTTVTPPPTPVTGSAQFFRIVVRDPGGGPAILSSAPARVDAPRAVPAPG